MSRKTLILSNVLLALFAATAWACLWDSDTLQMERQRFPGVLEIITGKFVRHSRAYYEWRIIDRKKKVEATPGDPALIDDLAVAYAKLGRPEEGIALLEPTLASRPDRYETLSNLGTLLFFAGRLDESKDYIRRALEINADAHFGRERYQLLLTEYLQQSDKDSDGVMCKDERYQVDKKIGFAKFVLQAKFGDEKQHEGEKAASTVRPQERMKELRSASKGVLGMMHFADYRSPVLLEALGDLLMTGEVEENATQLAAFAYLSAAQASDDPATATRFRQMARQVFGDHIDFHELREEEVLPTLESRLNAELASASTWFSTIEANEKQWIAENREVDREFAKAYYDSLEKTIAAAEVQLQSEPLQTRLSKREREHRLLLAAGAICIGTPVALLCLTVGGFIWWRRRRWQTAKP